MERRSARIASTLTALLTAGLLAASGALLLRVRPYWVAKYRGEKADLRGAALPLAPLARAHLTQARLQRADLRGANLSFAILLGANLAGADLSGADLTQAF